MKNWNWGSAVATILCILILACLVYAGTHPQPMDVPQPHITHEVTLRAPDATSYSPFRIGQADKTSVYKMADYGCEVYIIISDRGSGGDPEGKYPPSVAVTTGRGCQH